MGLIMRDSVPYAGSNDIVLTQAQYDALVQAGEVLPNVNYYISNANHSTPIYASGVHYDNSGSGLIATNVQGAVDEIALVKSNIGNIDNVTLTTPAVGDTLTWNGSAWVNTRVTNVTKSINQLWGTSVESNYTNRSQFLIIVAATEIYTVWFASTDNVNVKCWSTNTTVTDRNSATLNGFTFTRTNQTGVTNIYKLGISTSNSTAFTIFN